MMSVGALKLLNRPLTSGPLFVAASRNYSTSTKGNETFVVTGGQGFIGAYVIKHLLEENEVKQAANKVVMFDVRPDQNILKQVLKPTQLSQVETVYGNAAETDEVVKLIESYHPTSIIHLAGLQIPTCKVNPILGAKVNVIGTLNIFEAARLHREKHKTLPSIVYASSAAVSGNPEDYKNPVTDDQHHKPLTHYGVFKGANEGGARVYWHDHKIPSVGLRPFTVYGVGREFGLTSAPTKAMKAAVLGRQYNIPFGGEICVNYADDIARIFVQCSRAKQENAYALNIRGDVISVEEFVRLLEQAYPQAKGLIKFGGSPLPYPVHFLETGLSKLLGQDTVRKTPVSEAIKRTVTKFKELELSGLLHDRDL